MSKPELDALAWALHRLKPCYEDSQMAVKQGVLALTASDNIKQYEALAKLVGNHQRWKPSEKAN